MGEEIRAAEAALNEEDVKEIACSCMDVERKYTDFSAYIINVTAQFQEPEPIIQQGDRIVVSRGNIAAIIGKPKAFKTFLISAIAAAFLEDVTLSLSGCGGLVLIIDTEQGKSHCNIVQKRIYRLCGWDLNAPNPNLVVLSLRELDAPNRLKITKEAISALKPDLVIIDGIRDLAKDFNDIRESSEIIGSLMTLSTQQNCAIINVLHQNKADTNARGHLGSELCNKSETVLQVVNENGIATVSPVYSRNREIEPFSFRVNRDGLPEGCALPKVEAKKSELQDLFRRAMFGSTLWLKKNLVEQLARITGKTTRTAERKIADALEEGILAVNQQGLYYHTLVVNNDDDLPMF